jgi:hypothetical protein
MIATRPFNWDASDAADEDLYAANAGNPALFDADGNRKKLDPTNPDHKDLIEDWFELYAEHGGEVEDPNVPPEDPPDKPVKPCEDDELILVELVELSYVQKGFGFEDVISDPSADRRQWVNQTPRSKEPDADRGRKITLKARVMWKSGRGADLAGHSVSFRVEPGAGNRENLLPAIEHQQELLSATTDSDGWTYAIPLRLSTYGGDKFRIRASLGKGRSDDKRTGTFTIWRKVFYEVETMRDPEGNKRPGLIDRSKISAEMERCFIDYVPAGHDSHPPHLYALGDVHTYTQGLKEADPDVHTPLLHYVLCDGVVSDKRDIFRRKKVSKAGTIDLVIGNAVFGDDDWINSARWKHRGEVWRDFPRDNLSFKRKQLRGSYRIYVDTAGVPSIEPGKKIILDIGLKISEIVGGYEVAGVIAVTTRHPDGEAYEHETLNSIMIHEAGHAFGVPGTKRPDGTDNPFYYYKGGGHCKFNKKECVMHGKAEKNKFKTFCPYCSDCLRGRDLSNLPNDSEDPYNAGNA